MAVFLDENKLWCDRDIQDLHAIAQKLDCAGFCNPPDSIPYYPLTEEQRKKARKLVEQEKSMTGAIADFKRFGVKPSGSVNPYNEFGQAVRPRCSHSNVIPGIDQDFCKDCQTWWTNLDWWKDELKKRSAAGGRKTAKKPQITAQLIHKQGGKHDY